MVITLENGENKGEPYYYLPFTYNFYLFQLGWFQRLSILATDPGVVPPPAADVEAHEALTASSGWAIPFPLEPPGLVRSDQY
jgi:hypothetical protein